MAKLLGVKGGRVNDVVIGRLIQRRFDLADHLLHHGRQLVDAGANGLVLFNRFLEPDIDLETLQIKPALELSSSMESLLRIRWIALIRGRVEQRARGIDIAAAVALFVLGRDHAGAMDDGLGAGDDGRRDQRIGVQVAGDAHRLVGVGHERGVGVGAGEHVAREAAANTHVGLIGCGHQCQRTVPSFLVHEDMQAFYQNFPRQSHPMGILSGMVNALRSFYPELQNLEEEINMTTDNGYCVCKYSGIIKQ